MHSVTPISFYLTSAHLTRTMSTLLPTQNPRLKFLVQLRVLSHFQLVIIHMFGRGLWHLKRQNLSLSFVLLSSFLLRNDVCVDIAPTCRNMLPLMPTRETCLQIIVQLRTSNHFQGQNQLLEIGNSSKSALRWTFLRWSFGGFSLLFRGGFGLLFCGLGNDKIILKG